MDIEKVGVIGAGTMGAGIAQVFAQCGFETVLVDIKEELLEKGLDRIKKSLAKFVEKGKLQQSDMDAALSRITTTTNMRDVRHANIIVEAVFEKFEVKEKVFKELDLLCSPETILASNTSSISITKLGAATKRPHKVVGMHFMNPVPLMKLVEVIRGFATNEETVNTVVTLAQKLGKEPVVVNDSPGFVSNRVLMPMINEAIWTLYEGVATKEAIDTVMKLGMNHPMGPLTLADLIGLDVCLYILNVLYEEFGDPKYRPCPLLKRMVEAGYLGRKTGRGFYEY
ncbi:MAG: 3-hydroxybutyryl-CoA dehydrogenase [Planctomycetota bacterium]|nr:MAG: 3-hydroxybutyryl-CoA dehydrogenase [Planctomycetota bacterium]